ncbi:MAG: adenylate/guanylate cyclase domain-containing protein [Deltaproteobacteria bacterium]|nr:adenylate/guanylate cyclase domain-containing protein [Deltaproteobacteria bacterium]
MERRLAAILSADVKGYSRLMGEDEEATLRTLTSHRQVMDPLIAHHRGRIVGTAGDSVLAEFASVVDAVQCAVVIQQTLKAENAHLPAERQMEFRIGINLGDVMVDGEQIYGDGVNIAARLEGLAEPGGICLSGIVHDQVKHKLALRYEDLGAQEVKNIAEPVRVWRVVMDEAGVAHMSLGERLLKSAETVITLRLCFDTRSIFCLNSMHVRYEEKKWRSITRTAWNRRWPRQNPTLIPPAGPPRPPSDPLESSVRQPRSVTCANCKKRLR